MDRRPNPATDRDLLALTRRHFFRDCRVGLGGIALASLLNDRLRARLSDRRAASATSTRSPPAPTHFAPKAKHVIFLFMAGGPSQLELFDYKPKLRELQRPGRSRSRSSPGKRFAFIKQGRQAAGHAAEVRPARRSRGAEVSELLAAPGDDRRRHRASSAGMTTDVFNHGPAKLFMNTGSPPFRPAEHGLVGDVRHRQRVAGPARLRRAAIRPARPARRRAAVGERLPADHATRACRSAAGGEPILNLTSPPGIDARSARASSSTRSTT